MKILFVADVSIASVASGAERVLYEQCTRLSRGVHEVHLLTRRLSSHKSDEEEIDGVKECRYRFNKKLPYPFLRSTFRNCRSSFNSLKRNSSFHMINFHQPFTAVGVLSSRASRGIPTVYTCHSLSFEEYASQSSRPINLGKWASLQMQLIGRKVIERKVLRKSDHIVVLSEYTKAKLQKAYGLSPTKIHIIPGGVDLDRFRPYDDKQTLRNRLGIPNDHFTLLTVRNLEPRMGLENLILAFRNIMEAKTHLFLVVGGEGPLTQDLKSLAREAGIADLIKFTGYIPEEELPLYYRMADLFILPTEELEGFGLITVEALASGLPVLGTPVGGTKEILAHMGPEFLFADPTPDSMAQLILEAINTWASDSEVYEQISRKCRRVAENHYSWDTHIIRLENLFQVAVQESTSNLANST